MWNFNGINDIILLSVFIIDFFYDTVVTFAFILKESVTGRNGAKLNKFLNGNRPTRVEFFFFKLRKYVTFGNISKYAFNSLVSILWRDSIFTLSIIVGKITIMQMLE